MKHLSFSVNPTPVQNYASYLSSWLGDENFTPRVYVVQMDEKFAYCIVA